MIPKIIHYVWLGRKAKPIFVQRCIASWYTFLKGYDIRCWNEDNLDLSHPYLVDSMDKRKYAFAADYVRFKVLSEHGGIYLDTDMEVLRRFDDLLNLNSFIAYEDTRTRRPSAGVIGSKPNSDIASKMIEYYSSQNHCQSVIICDVMRDAINKGVNDLTILPQETFYPYNPYSTNPRQRGMQLMASDLSENCFGIHHWQVSGR